MLKLYPQGPEGTSPNNEPTKVSCNIRRVDETCDDYHESNDEDHNQTNTDKNNGSYP